MRRQTKMTIAVLLWSVWGILVLCMAGALVTLAAVGDLIACTDTPDGSPHGDLEFSVFPFGPHCSANGPSAPSPLWSVWLAAILLGGALLAWWTWRKSGAGAGAGSR